MGAADGTAAAAITQRMGHRKLLWFVCAIADRSLRFIGIVVALMLWHFGYMQAGIVLIVAISLAQCLVRWVVHPGYRGWRTSSPKRNTASSGPALDVDFAAVVATVLPAAWFMDGAPEASKMHVAIIVFMAATVVGLMDIVIHGTIPEPPMATPKERDFFRQFMEPLRDRHFRPWLIFNFCWMFSLMLGATLVIVYVMEDLG